MGFTITPDKDLKIIKHKLTGVLDKSNMGKAWQEIAQMKEFSELGYNVLSDYRNAEFKFGINETDVLDELINSFKHILNGKKGAVVVNVPLYTAISVLVKNKFKDVPDYKAEIFSTEEAAIKWLIE